MAYTQFKGFKRVLTGATMQDDYLYFERTDVNAVEGKIWFNGVCYGSCRDSEIDKILEALEGFIPASGEVTNVKEYIDEAIAQLESDVTIIELGDGSFSGLTLTEDASTSGKLDYTLTLTNVAPDDEFRQEIADRKAADEALDEKIDAVSAATEAALEAEEQAREDADDDLQEQIDELSGSTDDLQAEVDMIETAVGLNADGTYVADDGQYVSAATSVLDATAKLNDALVQEVIDRNQAIEDAVDALIGDATESGNTLGKLEDRIEALDADAKEYHIVKTTTGLPETIKERYSLVDADGNVSGDTVDIPKDSHIVSINYITTSGDPHYQNLEYRYIDASGNTQIVYVDMSQLVLESEFASGVTSIDGVVRGVVDPASETFLTVGAAGFKLSGVQDAIDSAVDAEADERKDADDAIESALTLTAQTLVEMIEEASSAATTEVAEGTDAGNNLSIVESAGDDGHKIYTINLTDVASASALTEEISDREAADAAIQAELDAVESSLGFNGTAYTQDDKSYISGNTVAEDIHLLDAALDANNDAIIALQEALQEEEDARVSGDTTLDERITLVEDNYITAVTVNGVSAATQDNEVSLDIQADDIELGKAITADTASTLPGFAADDKVDEVLQAIVDKLNEATAGSYTGVTSSGNTLKVTETNLGNNIEFEKESPTETTVAAGHLELSQNDSKEWYGVMYWIDEETA